MSNYPGLFCVSMDTQSRETDSATLVQRQRTLLQLLEQHDVASNWTIDEAPTSQWPTSAEVTFAIPSRVQRGELVKMLRCINAALTPHGRYVETAVLDPHEARAHWDVLVRHGCHVFRPRSANSSNETAARAVRGGLWFAPMSCSFVGGSRRSVRSLFSTCQRLLVDSANRGNLFHLNVHVGNPRDSWSEEMHALKALLQTAVELRNRQRIRCIKLSEIPSSLTRKSKAPMQSVLRRAA